MARSLTPCVEMRPEVRERVRVRDRSGDFIVVSVDAEREVCDLVTLEDPPYSLDEVPFAHLTPITIPLHDD
jgi:hypothetical protein